MIPRYLFETIEKNLGEIFFQTAFVLENKSTCVLRWGFDGEVVTRKNATRGWDPVTWDQIKVLLAGSRFVSMDSTTKYALRSAALSSVRVIDACEKIKEARDGTIITLDFPQSGLYRPMSMRACASESAEHWSDHLEFGHELESELYARKTVM
jgi:hypothetical protein